MGSRGTIAVAGSVAQKPGYGGHTWVFLQYLLGFRRLGWDVLFLDRLHRELETGEAGARYLVAAMEAFGLGDSFALLDEPSPTIAGLPRSQILGRTRPSE